MLGSNQEFPEPGVSNPLSGNLYDRTLLITDNWLLVFFWLSLLISATSHSVGYSQDITQGTSQTSSLYQGTSTCTSHV